MPGCVVKALEIAARAYVLEGGRVGSEGRPGELPAQSLIREAYLGADPTEAAPQRPRGREQGRSGFPLAPQEGRDRARVPAPEPGGDRPEQHPGRHPR